MFSPAPAGCLVVSGLPRPPDRRELRSPLTALDMQGVPPEAFRALRGHPTLEAVSIRLGSVRAQLKLREIFPDQ